MSSIFTIGNFHPRRKIAAFDYNWTIVVTKSGHRHPRGKTDLTWFNKNVISTIKELYNRGYAILIFTNQSQPWAQDQIQEQCKELKVPIKVAIATAKDKKKPSTFLFDKAVTWQLDYEKSFYVGDALGRPRTILRKEDYSDMDKVFAQKVGLTIRAPEDIFHPTITISKVLEISPVHNQEIIVLVGYPASGKSHMAHNLFSINDYKIVFGRNIVEKALDVLKDKRSVVVDALNETREKRGKYIHLGKIHKIPVRCIHFTTSRERSMYFNSKRIAKFQVPAIVYDLYDDNFQLPSKKEGFQDIIDYSL